VKLRHLFSTAAATLAALVAISSTQSSPSAQQVPPKAPPAKSPYLKLVEPWPEENVLHERKRLADARPLFKEAQPLVFHLTANFKAVDKDHNPESKATFPGTIAVDGAAGKSDSLNVTLSARGHFRRMARNCRAVPLKIEFVSKEVPSTIFDGLNNLKLGTGCERTDEYDQVTLREVLSYQLFNMVTPLSFRARLAKGNYIQEKADRPFASRYAIFIEHENDVARRMVGRVVDIPRIDFKSLESDTLTRMMLFEYMIGNTDFSVYALHNVVIVQTPDKTLWPIPYDFDMSGIVHAPYAIPDRRLAITSVTQRLYRGPCRSVQQFDKAAAAFRPHKAEMLALIAGVKELLPGQRDEMRNYVEGFFKTIETPESIKKEFVNGCKDTEAM
jgi:hypothetical protein